MALNPTKFNPGEELSFTGKPMRVAGLAQYDAGEGKLITRYCLVGATGGPLVLQEEGSALAMLRPFPPAAPPVAEGSTVSVMGEKYALTGVRKMKLLGVAGEPPPGTPKAPLLLSGVFEGKMGSLLREMVPGNPAQAYSLLKPVSKDDVLTGEEQAKRKEGERLAAEVQAQAEEPAAESKPYMKYVVWAVLILVVAGLVYACSGSSDDDSSSSSSSSHSVRTGTGSHGHGGK